MNATDERKWLMRQRAAAWRKEGLIPKDTEQEVAAKFVTEWKSNSILVRAVFFVLAAAALLAFYGFCYVLKLPLPGVLTAGAGIAIAEYLIGARRWFGTGVEEALWLGGGLAAITELPPSGTPEAMLVIAAVFVAAWARLRNPLFGLGAAVLVIQWSEERADAGTLTAIVVAAVAMVALLREWQRPSTEWLLIGSVVVLPFVARAEADPQWLAATISLYLVFGAGAFVLAVMRRHHALFLAAIVALSIAATELARKIGLPVEAKLAIGGAFLLALAIAVSRLLRDRTAGLVLAPAGLTAFDEELQVAATLAAAAEQHPRQPQPTPDGGGAFGGAGASGDY